MDSMTTTKAPTTTAGNGIAREMKTTDTLKIASLGKFTAHWIEQNNGAAPTGPKFVDDLRKHVKTVRRFNFYL